MELGRITAVYFVGLQKVGGLKPRFRSSVEIPCILLNNVEFLAERMVIVRLLAVFFC